MELRRKHEEFEINMLSQYAQKSKYTKGRKKAEDKCDIRTEFQRDRDRIIHSKAFRRLKHKTQVFISPEGDHYRTRLTHTLEVSQIARTIARALNMNEDLTEAISLGHDLGHTPFGHAGESALNKIVKDSFEHNKQSLRIVDRIEKNGKGLNLTWEVKDGIVNHRTNGNPHTLEGKIVQLSDKIAYINHDIDDAVRAGLLKSCDIPKDVTNILGDSSSERINAMIRDTIINSWNVNDIKMSSSMKGTVNTLREFMFNKVYSDDRANMEKDRVENIICGLYKYFLKNIQDLDDEFLELFNLGVKKEKVVCDYIACMTDRFAVKKYTDLYVPSSWNIY